MKKKSFLIFLFFIFLTPSLVSAHYWDFVTIGQGDARWCQLFGTCEIDNLIVKNLTIDNGTVIFINKTVININVTGDFITSGNINAENATFTNLNVSNKLAVEGESFFNDNIHMPDSIKYYFGSDDDFSVEFDGNNINFLGEVGTPDVTFSSIGDFGIGDKLTFRLGGIIDNIKEGIIKVTVDLFNLSGNVTAENVFLPQYIFPHNNETIPVIAANEWTNITFTQEEVVIKQGITHTYNDNTNTTFTINADGIYYISFNADVIDTSPSASDIDISVRVIHSNGTEILGSVFETDITKIQVETELSHELLARLNAGNQIVFQFTADDDNVEMSTHGTFGEHPNSISVIIEKRYNLP